MQRLFPILCLILCTGFAEAQETQPVPQNVTPVTTQAPAPDQAPVQVTLENLVRAAARLNAIDLDDDRVLDDYARIVHCDIYQRYHTDEFTWRDVRTAMRQSIALKKNSFPVSFYLYRTETFGQYDFNTQTLPLTGDAIMRRTADLELMHLDNTDFHVCDAKLDVLPGLFVAILDKAIQMEAIPLVEQQAQQVVRYFDASGGGRVGYGRYSVTLSSGAIDTFHSDRRLDFNAHLDNIEFYLDPGFHQKFWEGIDTPIITKPIPHLSSLNGIEFKGVDPSAKQQPVAPLQAIPQVPASQP